MATGSPASREPAQIHSSAAILDIRCRMEALTNFPPFGEIMSMCCIKGNAGSDACSAGGTDAQFYCLFTFDRAPGVRRRPGGYVAAGSNGAERAPPRGHL